MKKQSSTDAENGNSMSGEVTENIFRLFRERGDSMYAGEPVSQTEHALQAAFLAEKDNSSSALIVAALLHDVGHLLSPHPEDCAESGIDDHHEKLGANFLTAHFGEDVVEPVRLHVPAKRYLCALDSAYMQNLSPASQLSLKLQGGPFTADEVKEFEALPFSQDAVRLRTWDDEAKVEKLKTPDLLHYQTHLQSSLNS
jgi:[1-hydroxy-2-(trimethylamino)ethyl]phosphonate dioxygenase